MTPWARRARIIVCAVAVAALFGLAPGAAASPSAASTLTVDPSQPSPTAPNPSPLQGFAPDGTTVGGPQLNTRGRVVTPGTAPIPADVAAKGWMVADMDSDAVLAAQDPHGRYYPASTLKTLTITTLFRRLDPNQIVTGTTDDSNIEGTRVGLVAGGQYSVQLLWQALLLKSGNDAANALARTAGGVPKTLQLMNQKAAQLQAYDTVAGTPSGLDVAGQTSSPYDLCLFMRQMANDPQIVAIAQTKSVEIPAVPPKYPAFQIANENQLTMNYPGAIAGKTGFTDAARHTFVASAQRNGRRLVVSLMEDEQSPTLVWQQAADLLDWGFGTDAKTTGVGTLVKPASPANVSAVPSTTSATAQTTSVAQASTPSAKHQHLPVWPILGGLVVLAAGGGFLARRRNSAH